MNILAHLHIACLENSSLIGNTVADFVKGDPYALYSKDIADGIMLHRKVDVLTDAMPAVKQAKRLFRPSHQRVAPITLDIVWDHFLSKNWRHYCKTNSVQEFNLIAKQSIEPTIKNYPESYQRFMFYLWQDNWLENYGSLDFIGKVLHGMANRRPKLHLLRETIIDIKQHYDELGDIFKDLYPNLLLTIKNEKTVRNKINQ